MALTQVQGGMLAGSSNTVTTIQSNGTTAITIDASQNVGVGTATPDAKFKVVASGANLLIGYSGNANYYDASTHTFRNFAGTNYLNIDTGGNVLIGTSSIGNTTSGNNVRFGQTGNGAMASVYQAGLANGGTLDIDVGGGGAGSMCILEASNSNASNATIATRTIYAVMGRGTTFTFTSIGTQNGTSGGFGFSMSCPVGGRLRLTNTSGSTGDVVLTLFGTAAY